MRDPKLINQFDKDNNYVSNQNQIMIMEENVLSSPKNSIVESQSPYLKLISNPSKINSKGVLSIIKSPTEVTELQPAGSSKISINLHSQNRVKELQKNALRQNSSNSALLKRDKTEDSILSMKKSETNMEGFKDMLNKSFA